MPSNSTRKRSLRQIIITGVETWKDIVGYEGYYQASDWGRVKSLKRVVPMIDGRTYKVREKILNPAVFGPYIRVLFVKGRSKILHLVHRVILETFVGPCPEGMECRHLNGNGYDNRLTNLCWGTKEEQIDDKIRHGTLKGQAVGEGHSLAKLTEEIVLWIRKVAAEGKMTPVKKRKITEMYGITETTVRDIVKRRSWTHI